MLTFDKLQPQTLINVNILYITTFSLNFIRPGNSVGIYIHKAIFILAEIGKDGGHWRSNLLKCHTITFYAIVLYSIVVQTVVSM